MYRLMTILTIGFLFFILWIIYLADSGGHSWLFGFVRSFPYGDKLGHFCLFGTLTLGAIIASRFRYFSLGKFKIYYAALVLSIVILGEELSQAYFPSRTFDYFDLVADASGILTAIFFASLVNQQIIKHHQTML
jgi:polysaccharide biosynthesis protein VpsQ